MILNLWNSLRGYVIIEVGGFSVERFMNLATHKAVYIWDVNYKGSTVEMKVSARAFKLLRGCARKTGCTIKIKSKHGYPFLAFRYRKRKILVWGVLFFVAAMYVLSSFVWLIEVKGNERVTTADILRIATADGLRPGARKSTADTDRMEQMLLKCFPELSWVDIHIKGTKATISLAEVLPKQELIDRDTPCDIVAKKDGLIVSMATSAGTPLKKEHDVVKKGDLLVSSELVIGSDETVTVREYVHARAEVWAKMYYDMTFEVPYLYTEKAYTGRTKKDYRINLLDRNINLIKINNNFGNYDKIVSRRQLNFGADYPLPIIIITDEYREFEQAERMRDAEQAKTLAESMVNGRIIREFDFEADIYDKTLEFTETEDGIRVTALITTLERIDEAVEPSAVQPSEAQE